MLRDSYTGRKFHLITLQEIVPCGQIISSLSRGDKRKDFRPTVQKPPTDYTSLCNVKHNMIKFHRKTGEGLSQTCKTYTQCASLKHKKVICKKEDILYPCDFCSTCLCIRNNMGFKKSCITIMSSFFLFFFTLHLSQTKRRTEMRGAERSVLLLPSVTCVAINGVISVCVYYVCMCACYMNFFLYGKPFVTISLSRG